MYLLKLILKNVFRHKLRAGLTILGIAVAILAFGLLRTVITTWHLGVETTSANRLVVRNAISLIFPLPLSYKEKIRQIEGVKLVSYGSWFGGIYIDKKNFFASFAVEPRSYLELYPEIIIAPRQAADFIRDRRSAVAGQKLIDKYGWKIGDMITLDGTIYPGKWGFVLRGIYRGRDRSTDETQFFFHWEYLNETLKKTAAERADQVGFYMISVYSPVQAADVAARIDGTFRNSLAETLTETERSFVQGFISMAQAIIVAIQVISLVVIIIIMTVVANTMAMTTRERIGEYAVLKTLGFGAWHIAALIFGESLVLTLLGCGLGVALTYPAAAIFGNALSSFFPYFIVEPATAWLDLGAGLLVAVAAALFPAVRAVRVPIAEGLRRIG